MPQLDHTVPTSTPDLRRGIPSEFLPEDEVKSRPPSVTIGLAPADVFTFVREFKNFPRFMRDLKEAKVLAAKVAHLSFEHDGVVDHCDVERLAEVSDQMVAWKTLGSSNLEHAGVIALEPAPGGRGTVVSMKMTFDDKEPGKIRGMISYYLGRDPKNEAYINLRRLKAYLETGEVPTIQGQPRGGEQ